MFGSGIVLMPDFEIENAFKLVSERVIITKIKTEGKRLRVIKLKKIEKVLTDLRS